MSNVSRTFYIKIEGFGELSSGSGTGELYRFTTRAADADDVPILLDVPGRLSSSIQPLKPIGSDTSVKFRLAYEASGYEDKVRPLIEDQERNRFLYGGGSIVQLTKGVNPSETTLNFASTIGLSTDTLYYLGGEAISFSAFPSSTTATVERGELSLYGGMYHTADQGLGPILTQTLPSPIGQLVEFGYVGGSAPLFTGRIREISLTDGLYIDISAVAVSSIAREMSFLPPQGPIGKEFNPVIPSSGGATRGEVESWGTLLIESGKYAQDSVFVGSGDGFVHIIHKDGGFVTFKHEGFQVASDPDYLEIQLVTGNSLVMAGDKNGLLYLAEQTYTQRTGGFTANNGTTSVIRSAYAFARKILNKKRKDLRFELAVAGQTLESCLTRVLSTPYMQVAGLSAGIPSSLIDVSIESASVGVTNTLSSSETSAYILPPTDAEYDSSGVFRQRKKTIFKTLECILNTYSLSLVCRTDGSLSLVDWTSYSELASTQVGYNDLSSTSSSMKIEENKSAPIIAVTTPSPDTAYLGDVAEGTIIDTNVDIQLIKSTRPVTSAQIRAAEAIETKYAVGTKEVLEGVVRPVTETRVDVFGIPRPEIVISILSENTIEPGDGFALTHPDLPTSIGARGMTNAACVAIEVAKDSASGVTTIKALVIDQQVVPRAKWAPAGVVVSVLGSAVVIEANVFTDADATSGPTTDAEAFELDLPSQAQLLDSTGALRIGCEISSRSGNSLTVINLKGVVPAAGDIITLAAWDTTSGEWDQFTNPPAYGADIVNTLGTTNDDAQVYS